MFTNAPVHPAGAVITARPPKRSVRASLAVFTALLLALVALPASASAVGVPANVKAEPQPGAVRVSWGLSSGLNSGLVLWWDVRWRDAAGTAILATKRAGAGARSYTAGVASGRTYAFQVRVASWTGTSAWSAWAEGAPGVVAPLPAQPATVSASLGDTSGAVRVRWTPGPAVEGGAVSGYRITAQAGGVTKTLADNVSPDALEATVQADTDKDTNIGVSAIGAAGVTAARVARLWIPQYSLPVVQVSTDGEAPIVSKDDYLTGTFSVKPAPGGSAADAYTGKTEIKGRGNSTWTQPKKPYRVKLDKAAALLGLPSSKHWVLLANFLDRSYLRNSIAFEFGSKTSLAWTPKAKPVELVLNGKYVGLYQLVEQVRIDKTRINIDALKATDIAGDALTGGYHIERDARWDPKVEAGFMTARQQPFVVKDPEVPAPEQLAYIKDYLARTETTLFGANFKDPTTGYASLIDVPSFVDWFLVHEFLRANDAWYSSTNLVKPRLGKLQMGPIWDFDLSLGLKSGSAAQPPNTAWVPTRSIYFKRLLEDPAFKSAVGARWQQLRAAAAGLPSYLDEQRALTAAAAVNDQKIWGGTNTQVAEAGRVRSFLQTRANWMDTAYPAPVSSATARAKR